MTAQAQHSVPPEVTDVGTNKEEEAQPQEKVSVGVNMEDDTQTHTEACISGVG